MPSRPHGTGIGRSLNSGLARASENATLRLRQRKTPKLKVSETVAHNSVFASIPDASGNGIKHSNITQPWGHSSVGRAVALQAIGLGFESPCLHQSAPGAARFKGV